MCVYTCKICEMGVNIEQVERTAGCIPGPTWSGIRHHELLSSIVLFFKDLHSLGIRTILKILSNEELWILIPQGDCRVKPVTNLTQQPVPSQEATYLSLHPGMIFLDHKPIASLGPSAFPEDRSSGLQYSGDMSNIIPH